MANQDDGDISFPFFFSLSSSQQEGNLVSRLYYVFKREAAAAAVGKTNFCYIRRREVPRNCYYETDEERACKGGSLWEIKIISIKYCGTRRQTSSSHAKNAIRDRVLIGRYNYARCQMAG